MLSVLHIDAMHVFESGQEHFSDDEVSARGPNRLHGPRHRAVSANAIVLSTSAGVRDLDHRTLQTLPAYEIISEDARQYGTIAHATRA